ncbi:hypothetical protein [Pseudonocardia humida]|uniref:Uncharacterized protein n=1 Tax=Pseudonocardia humida TaxID=2800819 RepID=A0ABT0ZYG5_9PSEU|nr:hypothetical protein [Pseudonocardia humida]MCO1655785.1 hypothetical protein [Pseudonocardia humida]
MSDPTAGGEQPRRSARPEPAARADPGAMAKADVRAILAKALGLRRIVELAAEAAAARVDAGLAEPSRPRPRRPRPT